MNGKPRALRKADGRTAPEESREAYCPASVAPELAVEVRTHRWIKAGTVHDQAEAARKLGLTRARVTQLLNQTLVALGIQEHVLLSKRG